MEFSIQILTKMGLNLKNPDFLDFRMIPKPTLRRKPPFWGVVPHPLHHRIRIGSLDSRHHLQAKRWKFGIFDWSNQTGLGLVEPWNSMTFHINWECHHPNWRTPSFFRGIDIPPTSWIKVFFFKWIFMDLFHGFSHSVGNNHHPNWRTHIFSEGLKPPTSSEQV